MYYGCCTLPTDALPTTTVGPGVTRDLTKVPVDSRTTSSSKTLTPVVTEDLPNPDVTKRVPVRNRRQLHPSQNKVSFTPSWTFVGGVSVSCGLRWF